MSEDHMFTGQRGRHVISGGITIGDLYRNLHDRLTYARPEVEFDIDALCQRFCCAIEEHLGIFPNIADARPSAPAPDRGVPGQDESWKEDPSADDRWNAGCDYAMTQLCAVLNLDPKDMNWDAATETLDGDIQSVLWGILRARLGEDWSPAARATHPAPPEWRDNSKLWAAIVEACRFYGAFDSEAIADRVCTPPTPPETEGEDGR